MGIPNDRVQWNTSRVVGLRAVATAKQGGVAFWQGPENLCGMGMFAN
jgi:hypothetical protein